MAKHLVLGGRVARLIGAVPREVAVVDATSINLFELLALALLLVAWRVAVGRL